jgi:hypothetical protein
MPICPKCGTDIRKLIYVGPALANFYGAKDHWDYEDIQFLDDNGQYECSKCGRTLFNNEEDARRFMNGE